MREQVLVHVEDPAAVPASEPIEEKIARLVAMRRRLGWSAETCAHQLGVTVSTWGRWERGESLPNSQVVVAAIDRFLATGNEKGEA